jgi:predicted nuclease with TOPRIM domain
MAAQADTIKELNKLYQENAIDVKAYNKRAKELMETLDEDIDVDQYEALAEHLQEVAGATEGLSKDLKTNEKEAKRVAAALLRYDSAIQDVVDNYDDWMAGLEAKDLQEQAEIIEDVRNAYADLLDIDGSTLSDDFLSSTENLELLKEAAYGSLEAYDALRMAVAKDIWVKCGLDASDFEDSIAFIED